MSATPSSPVFFPEQRLEIEVRTNPRNAKMASNKQKKQTARQYSLEARYVIFIKNFPVFVPPKLLFAS